MVTGKVKWFNQIRGFGFITADDGTEAFVHNGDIEDASKSLDEGQPVTFEMTQGPKGPKAVHVRKA